MLSDGPFIEIERSLRLTENKFTNSMGESAYENPHAERLNRTIKNSYLKHYQPKDFEQLGKQLARAVEMYNDRKPHDALAGLTPKEFEKLMSNQPKKSVNAWQAWTMDLPYTLYLILLSQFTPEIVVIYLH